MELEGGGQKAAKPTHNQTLKSLSIAQECPRSAEEIIMKKTCPLSLISNNAVIRTILVGYSCRRDAAYLLLTGDNIKQSEPLALSPFAGDNEGSKQERNFQC